MTLYPYKFIPIYKETIWGGRALERLFNRPLRGDARIGESWELADLAAGESIVAEGVDAGKSIHELMAAKGKAILGNAAPLEGNRFPLLLKLLDANQILSLQVHPDEAAAARMGPPAALKTECWYVLESRRGYILKGAHPGVTAEQFRQVLQGLDGELAIADMVERIDVKAGDFHYLPAGTVHALGPGVVVAEIQTPSDTTYRVSDWGRGREIHVREALDCIHFQPSQAAAPGHGGQTLLASPYFDVSKRKLPLGEQAIAGGRCHAWMVLEGIGSIRSKGLREAVGIEPGSTLLLPAELEHVVVMVEEDMTILDTTLPENR